MSSFFFWNSYFFLALKYFFGTMFGPKKYELFSFGTNIFFGTRTFFRRNVWPEKMKFPFCWNLFFFGRMFGLNMYEIAFFFRNIMFFELQCFDEINVGCNSKTTFASEL